MKKLRTAAAVLAVLLTVLVLLCSCGEEHEYELFFCNKTGVVVDSVYFSSSENDTWGKPVNLAAVSVDATIHFDFDSMNVDGNGPGVYDIGAVDANALNYDAFEVTLAVGDTITIYPASDEGEFQLTVTHADGTSDSYTGYAYLEEEG